MGALDDRGETTLMSKGIIEPRTFTPYRSPLLMDGDGVDNAPKPIHPHPHTQSPTGGSMGFLDFEEIPHSVLSPSPLPNSTDNLADRVLAAGGGMGEDDETWGTASTIPAQVFPLAKDDVKENPKRCVCKLALPRYFAVATLAVCTIISAAILWRRGLSANRREFG